MSWVTKQGSGIYEQSGSILRCKSTIKHRYYYFDDYGCAWIITSFTEIVNCCEILVQDRNYIMVLYTHTYTPPYKYTLGHTHILHTCAVTLTHYLPQ